MARRKKYNPERRAWKGRSYRKGGKRVRDCKDCAKCDRCFRDYYCAQKMAGELAE